MDNKKLKITRIKALRRCHMYIKTITIMTPIHHVLSFTKGTGRHDRTTHRGFRHIDIYIIKIHQWGDLTQDLQIPQWIPYVSIPVGLSLMFYHFLVIGWQIAHDQRETIHTNHIPQAIEELEK